MKDRLIKASEKKCKCGKPGHRWIFADIDIPAFVLCKKCILKFQMDVFDAMKEGEIEE